MGQMYFVAADGHSQWPEVYSMTETSWFKTIAVPPCMFAAYRLLEQLVSDNDLQFASWRKMESQSAPSSNGATESLNDQWE